MAEPTTHHVDGIDGVPAYTIDVYRPKEHRYALVIPVLNEHGRIEPQLSRIAAAAPSVDVVIADGGSNDGSTDTATLQGLGVHALLTKLGPGRLSAQLRMAFHYCLEAGYEAVITMDGNGKDGAEGIERIAVALNDGYDFVQGSRFVTGGEAINTPKDRWLAIRVIHAPITSAGARHWLTDTTNGFREHSRRLLADSRVAPLRDVFDSYELLAYLPVVAGRLGFRVTEVPVRREYPKGEATPTKIHGLSAQADLIGILFRAALGRYSPPQRHP